jgi:hypothetical protein
MDLASFDQLVEKVKTRIALATQHLAAEGRLEARTEIDLIVNIIRTASLEAGQMREMRTLVQKGLPDVEFPEIDLGSTLDTEKQKKPDIKGRKSGGAEHLAGKRKSTRPTHESGRATKRKSYGGEKGDEERRVPRRKPKGWSGPWP